jgi:hypothetical protein
LRFWSRKRPFVVSGQNKGEEKPYFFVALCVKAQAAGRNEEILKFLCKK